MGELDCGHGLPLPEEQLEKTPLDPGTDATSQHNGWFGLDKA